MSRGRGNITDELVQAPMSANGFQDILNAFYDLWGILLDYM